MDQRPPENHVSGDIIRAAYKVHTTLGPGLFESIYEVALAHELVRLGHRVGRQVPIAVRYEQIHFDFGFRADLLVDDLVVVELKSVERLLPVHRKQALTYVRLADKRLGLLLHPPAVEPRSGATAKERARAQHAPPYGSWWRAATPTTSAPRGSRTASFAWSTAFPTDLPLCAPAPLRLCGKPRGRLAGGCAAPSMGDAPKAIPACRGLWREGTLGARERRAPGGDPDCLWRPGGSRGRT